MNKLILIGLFIVSNTINGQWLKEGQNIEGDESSLLVGRSVDLNADASILAFGGQVGDVNNTDTTGYVAMYQKQNETWEQLGQNIMGATNFVNFGKVLKLDASGSIVAIGGASSDVGQVKIYQYNNTEWVQIGATLLGETTADGFGKSIGLSSDGSVLAIGVSYNNTNGVDSGCVKVYENTNGT